MAEVLETRDLTEPSQHGWAVNYRIRRGKVGEEAAERSEARGATKQAEEEGRVGGSDA